MKQNKKQTKPIDEINDYNNFVSNLEDATIRKKIRLANEIELFGDELLDEIKKKKLEKDKIKSEEIQFIVEKSKNKYDINELNSFDYFEIHELYLKIKNRKKSKFTNIIKFIFNLNK